MLRTMGRKKKTAGQETTPGRKPVQRTGKPVQVYLSEELLDALDAYVEASRPKTTKRAVIEMTVEDFLRKSGYLKQPQTPKGSPEAEG